MCNPAEKGRPVDDRWNDIDRLYTMMTILASGLMMRSFKDDDEFLDVLEDAGKAILSNLPQSYKEELIEGLRRKD
jgi:hypothetical protein